MTLRWLTSTVFLAAAIVLLVCYRASGQGWMAIVSVPLASASMAMLVGMIQEVTRE